jgi:hypothetical protein
MKRLVFFSVVQLVLFSILSVQSVSAHSTEIGAALAYLSNSQNSDGSWGGETSTTDQVTTTATVLETLASLGETSSPNYLPGEAWLAAQDLTTTDHISRRILAGVAANGDIETLVAFVDEMRKAWGGTAGYDINILDTALALRALSRSKYVDFTIIGYALAYLRDSINPDGGWGLTESSGSNIYVTSLVTLALQQYTGTYSLADEIYNGLDFLRARQNPDGGFGSSQSTVEETVLAYSDLVTGGTDNTVASQALEYLKISQTSNGSWLDDPFATALATSILSSTITGQVTDAATGNPIEGANACITDNGLCATTDASGNYFLAGIDLLDFTVRVSGVGYQSQFYDFNSVGEGELFTGLALATPALTSTITGQVTDTATGNPLAGANACITDNGLCATTDASGNYFLAGIDLLDFTVQVSAVGYHSQFHDFSNVGEEVQVNDFALIVELTTNSTTSPLFTDISGAINGSGAAAMGDVNGDGWVDMLGCGGILLSSGEIVDGIPTFQCVKEGLDFTDEALSHPIFVDIDGDGDQDLMAAERFGDARLYRNDSCGNELRFTDITDEVGLGGNISHEQTHIALADIDADGDLDVFLTEAWPNGNGGVLYLNKSTSQEIRFVNITAASGIKAPRRCRTILFNDYDNDGDADLYLGGWYDTARFYLNQGDIDDDGVTDFLDVTVQAGLGRYGLNNGATSGDIDNDGDLDILQTDTLGYMIVFRNDGDLDNNGILNFTDATQYSRISYEGGGHHGVGLGDIDNDGDLDLADANWGSSRIEMYNNNGDGTFSNITQLSGIGDLYYGVGTLFSDIDNDGDLDLWMKKLFMNNTNNGNYLKVLLLGEGLNRDAVGAKLRVWPSGAAHTIENLIAYREVTAGTSFFSSNDYILELGLQAGEYDLEAIFVSGVTKTLTGVWTGQTIEIRESSSVIFFEPRSCEAEEETDQSDQTDPEESKPIIETRISTDKIAYNSGEPVRIDTLTRNNSLNFSYQDLAPLTEITDPAGAVVYGETGSIDYLADGQFVETGLNWNTGRNPQGIYNVSYLVMVGETVLASSSASFEILNSAHTGAGITGNIEIPADPPAWGSQPLNYSLVNIGNEALNDLRVKILIIDPRSDTLLQTLEETLSLPLGGELDSILIADTGALAPALYMAVLAAKTPEMASFKTLDSVNFEVIPSLEVSSVIRDAVNLLVWLNDRCSSHEDGDKCLDYDETCEVDCIDVDLLEEILDEAVDNYLLVSDRAEFERELRSPFFTDIMILGDHHPLTDHLDEELREKVYTGVGLISSLWANHASAKDIFGLKVAGKLANDCSINRTVELIASDFTDSDIVAVTGRVHRLTSVATDKEVAGWISDVKSKDNDRSPAAVIGEFGKGRSLYLAFDLGLTLSEFNRDQLTGLIGDAIGYIHRPADPEGYPPYRLAPFTTRLKSLGGSFQVRLTDYYDSGLTLFDPTTRSWIGDNPKLTEVFLDVDQELDITNFALLPEEAGAYPITTEVGLVIDDEYAYFDTVYHELQSEPAARELVQDIDDELSALQGMVKRSGSVKNAIRHFNKVHDRQVLERNDIEKNIHDIEKAIAALLSEEIVDVSTARMMLAELLRVEQVRWYRYQ